MNRNEWKFDYATGVLLDAASAKHAHHASRLQWWEQRKEEVMNEVRSKGLEVSEDLASLYATSAAAGGPRITVKDDYQRKLNECHQKIKEHAQKVREYAGWEAVLESRPADERRDLHADDWLFFFGD